MGAARRRNGRANVDLSLTLIINGEPKGFPGPLDVDGLIAALGLEARKVAIERNLEIVPRSLYARTRLAEGDRIEIVHFVGGG
jgi:thiamine biosynthesis protein ThiS